MITTNSNQPPLPISAASNSTILDRILDEHAIRWSEKETVGIMNLYLDEQNDSSISDKSKKELVEQFGVCLEFVKCRARMHLRTLSED